MPSQPKLLEIRLTFLIFYGLVELMILLKGNGVFRHCAVFQKISFDHMVPLQVFATETFQENFFDNSFFWHCMNLLLAKGTLFTFIIFFRRKKRFWRA